jgi:hypothetical protein
MVRPTRPWRCARLGPQRTFWPDDRNATSNGLDSRASNHSTRAQRWSAQLCHGDAPGSARNAPPPCKGLHLLRRHAPAYSSLATRACHSAQNTMRAVVRDTGGPSRKHLRSRRITCSTGHTSDPPAAASLHALARVCPHYTAQRQSALAHTARPGHHSCVPEYPSWCRCPEARAPPPPARSPAPPPALPGPCTPLMAPLPCNGWQRLHHWSTCRATLVNSCEGQSNPNAMRLRYA